MPSNQPQPSSATPTSAVPDDLSPLGFAYWQDGDVWLGHLDEFPDYLTQGESLEDLKAHLLSLHEDLVGGEIPHVRRHGNLQRA